MKLNCISSSIFSLQQAWVFSETTMDEMRNIRGAYDKFPDFFSYEHLKLA